MKRIYWFINQLYKSGGSERISLELATLLNGDYDVTVVLLSDDEINEDLYKVDPNVKIEKLNINKKIIRNEDYFNKHNFFKNFDVFFRVFNYIFFKKRRYRKQILEMTTEDDILIYSSPFACEAAPKGRKNYYHYHYNSKYLKAGSNKFIYRALCKKPYKEIYLCEDTMNIVNSKNNKDFIYNPSRFGREENFNVGEKIKICFIARYEPQKNPLLALEMLKEVYKKTQNFEVEFWGGGFLYEDMEKYVSENNLGDFIKINNGTTNAEDVFRRNDLMIMTSTFEGFPLTVIEAASLSVPSLIFDFGDGSRECVKDGVSGYIIEKDNKQMFIDTLCEIISNKEKLAELKKGAYLYSETFEKQKIKEKWEKILDERLG